MAAQTDTAPVTQPAAPTQPWAPMRRVTAKASTVARRLAEADAPHPAINHPLYAVEGIAATSGFAHVAQEAPWWFMAGGGLAAVVGAAVAKARWRHAGTTLYTGISCAAAGVTATIGTEFGPWSGPGLGSLLLSGVAIGPWYGYLRTGITGVLPRSWPRRPSGVSGCAPNASTTTGKPSSRRPVPRTCTCAPT